MRPLSSRFLAFTMLVLMISAMVPMNVIAPAPGARVELPWWKDTSMDMNGNQIHDALEITIEMGAFIDNGRISVLVDFDHVPTMEDERTLIDHVDFVPRFRFHVINIISGTVPVARVNDLLDVPGVVFVSFNGPVEAFLDEAVPQHGADQVWDLGFTGEGMNIAVIDTGIDAAHVGLNDFDDDMLTYDPKVIAFYDAINSPNQTDGSTTPYDDQGHGSHCAGISAGTGEGSDGKMYRGVAPGSALIGVKVLDSGGSGTFDQVMAGMQWCIDMKDVFNIRAATMSLGGVWLIELTQSQEERLTSLANTMVHEGIALCIAAGNDGAYGTIGTPGAARDVITVGATDHNRDLAIYSSKGPTYEGLIKPNVAGVGGGAGVGSPGVMSVAFNTGNQYTRMSGTSMATPMVAGIMTIILQANPDLEPLTVRSILEYTAEYRWLTDPSRPNNDYGWGFVEALPALEEAVLLDPGLKIEVDPATPVINFSDNKTYYEVHQEDSLMFLVEGNATHLEYRAVDGRAWHTSGKVGAGGVGHLEVHGDHFELGNHSLWVRAVGPAGVSAPLHLQMNVGEEISRGGGDDDDDGLSFYIWLFPTLIVLVAVITFLIGRASKGN